MATQGVQELSKRYAQVSKLAAQLAELVRDAPAAGRAQAVGDAHAKLLALVQGIDVSQVTSAQAVKEEEAAPASTSQADAEPAAEEPGLPGPAEGVPIKIKPKGEPVFEVRCRLDRPLVELKQTIALERKLAVPAVKLLMKGKVLKDNQKKCAAYKIAEGVKITLLVKKGVSLKPYEPEEPAASKIPKAAPAPKKSANTRSDPDLDDMLDDALNAEPEVVAVVPAPAPVVQQRAAAAPGGPGLAGLMNNPMVQNMMKNPEMMKMARNMMGGMGGMQQRGPVGSSVGASTQGGSDTEAWRQGLSPQEAHEISQTCGRDHERLRSSGQRSLSESYLKGSPQLQQR